MGWTRLDASLLDQLMRFLGPLEASCVPFTQAMATSGSIAVPRNRQMVIWVRLQRDGAVNGAILQNLNGVFHPVLDPAEPIVQAEVVRRIARTSRRLFDIQGMSDHVDALATAFKRMPSELLTYHLMVQERPPPEPTLSRLPRGLEIRRARADEARHLFDIQKDYEIEEVLLPGSTFSSAATIQQLKRTLAAQIVFVAEINGIPVAKANTNARGIFHDQIGGVFTAKEYRSRGVGTAVMLRLLKTIGRQRKNGTLFVKKENGAAITMYQNVGFGVVGEFKISYFR